MKTKTPYNYWQVYVINEQPLDSNSLTVPDLSLTVREIIERHSRGLSLPQSGQPLYDGDEEAVSFDDGHEDVFDDSLDLVERHELMQRNSSKIDSLRSSLAAIEREKAKRAAGDEDANKRQARNKRAAVSGEEPAAAKQQDE